MRAALLCFAMVLTAGRAPEPITEITLTRSECFGPCPAFTATFKADGSVVYHGEAHVSHLGDFTATVDQYDFDRLAEAIDAVRFDELNDSYPTNVTDTSSIEIMVARKSKNKKVWAADIPPKVWLIARAMDAILAEAKGWKRIRKK